MHGLYYNGPFIYVSLSKIIVKVTNFLLLHICIMSSIIIVPNRYDYSSCMHPVAIVLICFTLCIERAA